MNDADRLRGVNPTSKLQLLKDQTIGLSVLIIRQVTSSSLIYGTHSVIEFTGKLEDIASTSEFTYTEFH